MLYFADPEYTPNGDMDMPCPVCLGAGSFSDRMPARDSIADAETLRTEARSRVNGRWSNYVHHSKLASAIRAATSINEHVIVMRPELAPEAAHLAFKACPGLRG